MTHETEQLLNELHQRTESILQKAIQDWQMLPPAQLSVKPAPDKWSPAQCLEHLNFYGHHYLPAIENAIQAAKERNSIPAAAFKSGWLGEYFTQLMLPQPGGGLKSTMKSPKNAVPAAEPEPLATLAEFMEQQERMLQLLEAARAVNLMTTRVPISLSPWIRLRLGDTFSFVVAHNERHVLQLEKGLLFHPKILADLVQSTP